MDAVTPVFHAENGLYFDYIFILLRQNNGETLLFYTSENIIVWLEQKVVEKSHRHSLLTQSRQDLDQK